MLARRTRHLVLLALLCGGCAPPFEMVQEPRLPPCRAAVDQAGRPQDVEVRWFGPAAGSDRRTHARWCGTVGPLVIKTNPDTPSEPEQPVGDGERRAEALPHTSQTHVGQPFRAAGDSQTHVGQPFRAAPDEIAIVSWNIHVGGGDVVALVNRLRAGRWSNGRPVRHFVLLLQEVFRGGSMVPSVVSQDAPVPGAIEESPPSGPRMDVVQLAEELGLSLFYAPSMRNGRSVSAGSEDRGNAILATFPLSDAQVVELPFERQRRVPVVATLDIGDPAGPPKRLRVCSAHLDNRVTHRRLYVFAPPGRTRQTKGLLDALPGSEPLVLGGDFNTWFGEAEGTHTELRRVFADIPPGRGKGFGSARLDYVFFRLPSGWRADWHVLNESFGSDHRPVIGWLRPAPAPQRGTRDAGQP